jgi:hypothetical protein
VAEMMKQCLGIPLLCPLARVTNPNTRPNPPMPCFITFSAIHTLCGSHNKSMIEEELAINQQELQG